MNFIQMHERLRLELQRRIQRGTLSVSLLARQTGFGQAHLSNFLHSRRQLSIDAIDRILSSLQLSIPDLLPAFSQDQTIESDSDVSNLVPIVSHSVALFEPYIRTAAIQGRLHLPHGVLDSIRPRVSVARRTWQRFVAIRIPPADALPMEPVVFPDAIALIDRHYDSLTPYRPNRPNLYAVRNGSHLLLRYAEFLTGRLVLRPYNNAYSVDLIEVSPDHSPRELIAGRVALILNEP